VSATTTNSTVRVGRRLAPLYASAFTGGIALWVPVEKLFLDELGFTPAILGVMAALYAAAVPLLEVPSGILADRWSRRGVLVIGNLGALASVAVGGLSTGVAMYLVAAVLLGVYFAMQSGTLDAIVYDAVLEETGSSDTFEAVLGRLRVVSSAALVIGALAGGALAALTSPRFTYFATLPLLVVSTVALLCFREPKLHQGGESMGVRQHIATAVNTVRCQPQLLPIVALLVVTSLLTQAVYEFGPLWLVAADAGPGLYGPAWALLMASLGLGGAIASRLRIDRSGPRIVVVGLLAISGLTLLVVRDPIVATVAQVVLATFAVAAGVVGTRLLHDRIASSVRASVSSGVGAATWLTFVPFAIAFGALADQLGIQAGGWLLMALTVASIGLLWSVSRPRFAQQASAQTNSAINWAALAAPSASTSR
jgi:MFS family permease